MNAIAILASFVIFALSAEAYPENTRHGYTSCSSCHFSPAGGGTLTNYGRMTAEEFSTFSKENSGNLDYGYLFDYPKYFFIGGDVRYLSYGRFGGLDSYNKQMIMQADIEGLWKLSNQVMLSGTYGFYALDQKDISVYIPPNYKLKNYYLLLHPRRSLTIRAGKFVPAFGLMIPDHMEPIRRGIVETEAVEIGWIRKSWEVLTTFTEESYKVRASIFLGKSIVGSSFDYTKLNSYANIFSFITFKNDLYFMLEYNFFGVRDEGYTKIGYEIFRGIHATTGISYDSNFVVYNSSLRWFPYPHFDLDLSVKTRNVYNGLDYSAIAHYYW